MKKQLKKIINALFPKGDLKEQIKLAYYGINKPVHTHYGLAKGNNGNTAFKTIFKGGSLITNQALYFVVPDFNYYQHFYKVKVNDVVLDVGANCGYLSLFFSKWVGKDGLVYAFEPDRFNIEGAEIEALDGCVATIENLKPNFAIASYNIVDGEATYIKVEEFFKKRNYPCKKVRFRKKEIITFAGPSLKE